MGIPRSQMVRQVQSQKEDSLTRTTLKSQSHPATPRTHRKNSAIRTLQKILRPPKKAKVPRALEKLTELDKSMGPDNRTALDKRNHPDKGMEQDQDIADLEQLVRAAALRPFRGQPKPPDKADTVDREGKADRAPPPRPWFPLATAGSEDEADRAGPEDEGAVSTSKISLRQSASLQPRSEVVEHYTAKTEWVVVICTNRLLPSHVAGTRFQTG